MDKLWKCKYSDYDETFDPETGDEFQYFMCKQGFDTDECDKCSNFEEEFWDDVYRETPIEKLKPSPHINNITYPFVCRCDMNRNDESEKEDEKCCCNCLHCARWSTSKGIECHCDLTDRYLSYLDVMDTDNDCSRWEKETKWDLEKEHALKIIKAMRTNWDEDSKTPNAHALDMATEALEKQIPKKWEYEMVNDDDTYVCPCCKEYWYMDYGTLANNKYNYCPNCGQALKWE